MPDPLSTGLLLKLDITVWTGIAALSAPDLGLDPASIAAHYTLGRKRLVPKRALDPIATVVRQARYALDSLSHPLPDGSRFVLEVAAPEVEAQLRRKQADFEAAVAAFLAAYPAHRTEMAAEWGAAACALSASRLSHFSITRKLSGPHFAWIGSVVSASSAAPYSRQPFSARTAGTLARKWPRMLSRWPGLAVMTAIT